MLRELKDVKIVELDRAIKGVMFSSALIQQTIDKLNKDRGPIEPPRPILGTRQSLYTPLEDKLGIIRIHDTSHHVYDLKVSKSFLTGTVAILDTVEGRIVNELLKDVSKKNFSMRTFVSFDETGMPNGFPLDIVLLEILSIDFIDHLDSIPLPDMLSASSLKREIKMKPIKKMLFIFRKECLFGFAGAYLAWSRFGAQNVEFRAMTYGDKLADIPIADVEGRDIVLFNFSFAENEILNCLTHVSSLQLYSHHNSVCGEWHDYRGKQEECSLDVRGIERLKLFLGCEDDIERSALRLFYTENICYDIKNMPIILQHIELSNMTGSPSCATAGFQLEIERIKNLDFAWFRRFTEDPNEKQQEYIRELFANGKLVLDYQNQLADNIINRSAGTTTFAGYDDIPISPAPRELQTIIGMKLAKNAPFSITFEDDLKEKRRTYSLRSISHSSSVNGVDVSEIARKFGGGGQKHAAGFVTVVPHHLALK